MVLENRRAAQPAPQGVPYVHDSGRRPAPFAGLRRFLAILCAVVALISGASGGLAYFAQKNFVESAGFSTISSNLAHDQDFQQQLADAVTNDLMETQQVKSILGDGNSKNVLNPLDILGSVQDWGYDQVKNMISGATTAVISAQDYPGVWNQMMMDTHDYNLDSNNPVAALDTTAVYQEVDSRVGTFMGFDPDFVGSNRHIVELNASNGTSLHDSLMQLKNYAATWQTQLIVAAIALVLAFLLWPRGKLIFLGIIALLGGALLWGGSLFASGISTAAGSLNITNSVGQVFVQGLANQYAAALATFAGSFVIYFLITAVVLILLGIAVQLAMLSAKGATSRSRKSFEHVG